MKIVFFGTPDFALTALQALYQAGHTITGVVTQPDKPKGRGREMSASPVKGFALAHDISVLQPKRVRDEEAVSALRALDAEIFVVAAFGQILPKEVLDIPPLGCINIHASLLPLLRGAAPIQAAILEGHAESGITIMRMDEGCDTGDILLQKRCPVTDTDTGGSLFDKLAALGALAIVEALPGIADGTLAAVKQNDAEATMAAKLNRESGKIDWKRDAAYLSRLIRAVNPWPSAVTTLNGKRLKIWEAHPETAAEAVANLPDSTPGTILSATSSGITVQTGEGALTITALQAEGKKRMDAAAFLNGTQITSGMVFGG